MLNEVLETSKDTEDEEVDSTADPVDENASMDVDQKVTVTPRPNASFFSMESISG